MTNAEAPRLSMRQRRITGLVIYNALMVLLCLVIIYPLIWTIFSSFKTNQQIFSESPINLIPRPFTTGNYQKLLTIYDVPLMVFNGLYLAIVIPVLSMLTSSMAAYALARLRFRGRNVIFLLLISTMMIPGYVTLIPNFAIMVKLKLLNSHWALILRSALSGSATSIFLFRQFFLSIPRDLENAAIVDGCSHFRIWAQIFMPLTKPIIATLAVFQFQSSYNDFLGPVIYISSDVKFTVQMGLNSFRNSFSTRYDLIMAGSIMSLIPVVILFICCQKYIVRGIVMGGVKG